MNELSSLFGDESAGPLALAANPSGSERSAGKIIAIGTPLPSHCFALFFP
jgi:hypothetical protein